MGAMSSFTGMRPMSGARRTHFMSASFVSIAAGGRTAEATLGLGRRCYRSRWRRMMKESNFLELTAIPRNDKGSAKNGFRLRYHLARRWSGMFRGRTM